ncbi:unnamed protein product [Brachionus calyciflorus]|uniref:Uncharacterized protein n=1 Tax=Brachionus calyciflorus TaxID=104777 RepID=A0A813MUK9_9BILA|nr:unnamed protein product [Brachionus calyciflorus]
MLLTYGLNNVAPFANKGQNREELAEALSANPLQALKQDENRNVVVENDNPDVQVNREVYPVFQNAQQEQNV